MWIAWLVHSISCCVIFQDTGEQPNQQSGNVPCGESQHNFSTADMNAAGSFQLLLWY